MTNPAENETPEAAETETPSVVRAMRRQPCPCGSGKKFKNCHEGEPGYEVANDLPVAAQGVIPPSRERAFPGKQNKTIASQKDFHSYHYRRGG